MKYQTILMQCYTPSVEIVKSMHTKYISAKIHRHFVTLNFRRILRSVLLKKSREFVKQTRPNTVFFLLQIVIGRRPAVRGRRLPGAPAGCGRPRRRSARGPRSPCGAGLKGSIGEGPNHSNYSDQSSVRILGIERKPFKIQEFSLENS